METPAFQYTPLPNDDQIRTLELLPGEGLDQLEYKLQPASLDNLDTLYHILSYAWGDIRVDCRHEKQLVTFPESLYRALLRLHPTQSRMLWADALSIDQKNEHEKNHQVRMMRRSMIRAHRVLIWLGDACRATGFRPGPTDSRA